MSSLKGNKGNYVTKFVSIKMPKALKDRFNEKSESKFYRTFTEFVLESTRNLLK